MTARDPDNGQLVGAEDEANDSQSSLEIEVNRQDKMVTIRMSAEQHNWLAAQANKEGVSMNTFCLRQMGLETPFKQSGRKRGRKLAPVSTDLA